MAYENVDALAQQMAQLATTHDWIAGYVLDYEADCGYGCDPGHDHGVQNLTECMHSRLSCEAQEAGLLATFMTTLSTALHAKGKSLSFAVSGPRGAGFEHWPYYGRYLKAGVDRLYEMGESSSAALLSCAMLTGNALLSRNLFEPLFDRWYKRP